MKTSTMFFVFVMIANIALALAVYHLYRYRLFYGHRDFVYIPDLRKQKIILSASLKKSLDYDPTFDDFVRYFFKDNMALLYKSIEKRSFSFYMTHQKSLLKVVGFRIGGYGCVLEFYTLDTLQQLNEHLKSTCQTLQTQVDDYEYILNHLPIIISKTSKEGVIHYCNQLYASFLETTEQEVIKSQMTLDIHSKFEYLSLKGKRYFFAIESIKKDEDIIMIGIDKTDYDALEKEFEDYLTSTHNIFQQFSTPIAVFNSDQALIFFNKAYHMLFGFDAKFLAQQPLISEVLDDLRQRQRIPEPQNFAHYKKIHKSFFSNLLEPFEETLHLANGQVLRSVVSPQPSGGVLYMYEDITHHLQLEKEHKSLSAAQKEILDHLHEGVVVFGSDYRLRLSNPMVREMFKLTQMKEHIDAFMDEISTPLFNRQMILEIFEKRVYTSGNINKDMGWSYTPLPEGSHLLNFFYMFKKTA